MKRRYFTILFIFIFGTSVNLFSQGSDADEPHAGGLFENYGVALKIGTYGVGVDFSTSLHPNIKTRVGFGYFGFSVNSGLKYDCESVDNPGKDITVEVESAEIRFPNANLLVDYFPWRSVIFHVTAGLYFGQNKIQVNGNAPEAFIVEGDKDYVIRPKNGKFDARVNLGGFVKPYFGLGVGRTILKHRVGCKFELGIIYQGKLSLESDYMDLKEMSTEMNREISNLEVPTILTRLWPIMNFSVSYRIK